MRLPGCRPSPLTGLGACGAGALRSRRSSVTYPGRTLVKASAYSGPTLGLKSELQKCFSGLQGCSGGLRWPGRHPVFRIQPLVGLSTFGACFHYILLSFLYINPIYCVCKPNLQESHNGAGFPISPQFIHRQVHKISTEGG